MPDQSLGVEADATVTVRHSRPPNCPISTSPRSSRAIISLVVPSELSGVTSSREAGGSSR
jgi:hypothetical protein